MSRLFAIALAFAFAFAPNSAFSNELGVDSTTLVWLRKVGSLAQKNQEWKAVSETFEGSLGELIDRSNSEGGEGGFVVVGRLNITPCKEVSPETWGNSEVEDVVGEIDPRRVFSQAKILEKGIFLTRVLGNEGVIEFKLDGFEPVVLTVQSDGNKCVNIGTVSMVPNQTPISVSGSVRFDTPGEPQTEDRLSSVYLRLHPVPTPSSTTENHGFSGDYYGNYGRSGKRFVPVKSDGSFHMKGMIPSVYLVQASGGMSAVKVFFLDLRSGKDVEGLSLVLKPNHPLDKTRNSVGMTFESIYAGVFISGWSAHEGSPQRAVKIGKDFLLGKHEVTEGQYETVMKTGVFSEDSKIAVSLSKEEAESFISKLNEMEKGRTYRLPTSHEWEYAATAGIHTTPFYYITEDFVQYMEVLENKSEGPQEVGSHDFNPFELHDMLGNVAEFTTNEHGSWVVKGGDWSTDKWKSRASITRSLEEAKRDLKDIGLRLVLEIESN
jgi:formylglycine-generating enzyme required for sulfatase activity